MKRFYQAAQAGPAEDGRYTIRLDGKPARTPAGRALALPTRALAEAVAAEWAAQGERILPAAMPLTAIANAAIDRIAERRAETSAAIARFAETDLLCYRADDPALAARQGTVWQPILDWAAAEFGARLAATRGILPIAQNEGALAGLRRAIEAEDDFRLAALSAAVAAMGSLLLGLALAAGRLDAQAACAAAELDEAWQNERWGEDAEAMAARFSRRRDVEAAALVFRLHPSVPGGQLAGGAG